PSGPRSVLKKAANHGCRKTPRRPGQAHTRVPIFGSTEPAPQSCKTPDSRTAVEFLAARSSRASLYSTRRREGQLFKNKEWEQPECGRWPALRSQSEASTAESRTRTAGRNCPLAGRRVGRPFECLDCQTNSGGIGESCRAEDCELRGRSGPICEPGTLEALAQ